MLGSNNVRCITKHKKYYANMISLQNVYFLWPSNATVEKSMLRKESEVLTKT